MDNFNEILKRLVEAVEENTLAIERLRDGDYYGDPLPDSLGDIAASLREISGRNKK